MAKLTKRQKAIAAAVEANKVYTLEEAVEVLNNLPAAKFKESLDVAVNLGVDPRKPDQVVRGATTLPAGTGKTVRVAVFAQGAAAEAAKVPRHLERMYDHREFGETLHNYGLKTKIGALSDLLSEYDTNDSFKEAMNKGLLSIDTPENLGRAYNRDRVEFDNSIIEQFQHVNRPLPEDDDDAWIKDPEIDSYHSTMTIEDITKEEYDRTLSSNGEYTMWVTKELGGAYDATKQQSS